MNDSNTSQDDHLSVKWKQQEKHFFILSSSGKPIYSFHGDELKLASIMGVIQAYLSFFIEENDPLLSFKAGEHKFVFYIQGPLYLVAVSSLDESERVLTKQLELLYAQVIFSVPIPQLNQIFDQHINFDLRNLLMGTDVLLNSLIKSFDQPWLFLESVRTMLISTKVKKSISKAWNLAKPPKTLSFGMLIANKKLVTLVQPKKHSLGFKDIALIINLIYSSSSFRAVESWSPVCLAEFNSSGYLHCYSCFITPDLCLVLLSVDKNAFFILSQFKRDFVQQLEDLRCVEPIEDLIKTDPINVVELGIPGLRHVIFKYRGVKCITETNPIPPYTMPADQNRLYLMYQIAQSRLGKPYFGNMSFHITDSETVVLYKSTLFEIYAAFSPLIKKEVAHLAMWELGEWIQHRQDNFLL
ncbi:vacuolar fusion protein MON1 [Globomyces pollinis-pini]|nr:vacuolar fusion protein MON1 [Globomyces pollinis-pini]